MSPRMTTTILLRCEYMQNPTVYFKVLVERPIIVKCLNPPGVSIIQPNLPAPNIADMLEINGLTQAVIRFLNDESLHSAIFPKGHGCFINLYLVKNGKAAEGNTDPEFNSVEEESDADSSSDLNTETIPMSESD
ncbi:hypothetical protein HYFRA_00004024 [Hymenoscyphus fraxineus]|uniref:Uncharacterized protein n=1 Tax=Hymenoscyphus fraxineus TaxID=746836 RepID=A0A9N9KMD7_9HELO|nr:hypothetical protein HYFRA_00004024 [Hymenoscyphus fraxineus]